tara:strand:+ start:976 stop:1215 length:240 start_codon:yes stop_codon:yes gene_type:complete
MVKMKRALKPVIFTATVRRATGVKISVVLGCLIFRQFSRISGVGPWWPGVGAGLRRQMGNCEHDFQPFAESRRIWPSEG